MPKRALIANVEEAYDEAVRQLTRKARTEAEVAAMLESKSVARDDIASVIARLKSHRHLDDVELAGDQAFALVEGKGLAPKLAVEKLLERGVRPDVAEAAVDEARENRSDAELCARALARKTKGAPLDEKRAAKEGRALARLGYDEDVVLRALEKQHATESR